MVIAPDIVLVKVEDGETFQYKSGISYFYQKFYWSWSKLEKFLTNTAETFLNINKNNSNFVFGDLGSFLTLNSWTKADLWIIESPIQLAIPL